MAARTVKIRHDEETRAKIQTSQLINRLTEHALGNVDMPATAVTAALGLIRKTLPDLTSQTISGDEDQPLRHEISWKSDRSSSTTSPAPSSSTSTTEQSALPASLPTDEPEKQ